LTGTDLPGAVEMADRIRETVSQIVVPSSLGGFGFTVSIGVASFADDDRGWADSLNRADQAMYQAKQSGRNRVVANGETQTAE
jgi:diguanylate cyclase (GGDEF)-like protein